MAKDPQQNPADIAKAASKLADLKARHPVSHWCALIVFRVGYLHSGAGRGSGCAGTISSSSRAAACWVWSTCSRAVLCRASASSRWASCRTSRRRLSCRWLATSCRACSSSAKKASRGVADRQVHALWHGRAGELPVRCCGILVAGSGLASSIIPGPRIPDYCVHYARDRNRVPDVAR